MAGPARRSVSPDPPALRAAWRDRERWVLLHAGDDQADCFLRAWQIWQQDPSRPGRLDVLSLQALRLDAGTLVAAHATTPVAALARRLAAVWPPATRNLHRLAFDQGRVHLLLGFGALTEWLPALRAQVDGFVLDAVGPCTDLRRLGKGLARLAAPLARLVAFDTSQALRDGLRAAGFEFDACTGDVTLASYRPRFVPRGRVQVSVHGHERHALIVGAGLAGCAAAWALAEQGWQSTVIDRACAPARQASGNPAGLFHASIHAHDGAHMRFNRAAALQARQAVHTAIAQHGARGGLKGLLRLDSSGRDAASMQDLLQRLQLPAEHVQALAADEAGHLCGLPLRHPAWFHVDGGWVQPAALARSLLTRAGTRVCFRGGLSVQRLQRDGHAWRLLDEGGRCIELGRVVVLANAFDALRLLQATHWPVQAVRGQLSLYDNAAAVPEQRLRLPRLPLVGTGYLLPALDGWALFGASAQAGDDDQQLREADHDFNLQRLYRLSPQAMPPVAALQGRVGWRCVAGDRMPLVGAVPDETTLPPGRAERLREIPRREGLYVIAALASRGIAWSVLGGQVLAAQISGAPVPLESALTDALDPARFAHRARCRA
jgi:tRNA 5-methylaminomethyl-2-thiouridine biosynthesis bifunctional protein